MTNRRNKIQVLPLIILVALTIAFFLGGGRLQDGGVRPTAVPVEAQRGEAAISSRPADKKADVTAVPGDKQAVAAYIMAHGQLPDYYITKEAARAMGWSGGSLEPYAPGRLIGGDRFGNYEKLLPTQQGRIYWECDIGTYQADSRGTRRIVFSDDGLIYYTEDHYSSFTPLVGGE